MRWDGARYATLGAFTAATGQEKHGLNVAPGFANPAGGIYTPTAASGLVDRGVLIAGINDDYVGGAPDIGAFEFTPSLTLHGAPGDRAIHLNWEVNTTLPVTSTWRIAYEGPAGNPPSPITGIISPTRAYTLTGLTNYTWYTVTLNAMLDGTPFLTDTVRVMPTDRFVYLPLVLK